MAQEMIVYETYKWKCISAGWQIFQCRCVCSEKILDVTERAGCDIRTDIQQENGADTDCGSVLDVSGKYVIPGLVDIHSHGAVNADASDGDAEGLRKMSRYYAQKGVTSWCPTTMTLSEEQLLTAMHAIRDLHQMGQTVWVCTWKDLLFLMKKRCTECSLFAETETIEELKN